MPSSTSSSDGLRRTRSAAGTGPGAVGPARPATPEPGALDRAAPVAAASAEPGAHDQAPPAATAPAAGDLAASDPGVARRGDWRAVVRWMLVTVLAAAVGLELLGRGLGHHPSIRDDKSLWCLWRERAASGSPDVLALVGASRLQRFHAPSWNQRFPRHEVVQLAIPGSSPFPTLASLADDEGFRGTVLCSFASYHLPKRAWKRQAEWDEHYREEWGASERALRQAKTWLEGHLVLLNRQGYTSRLVSSLAAGELPTRYYLDVHADRSHEADYSLAGLDLATIEAELPEFHAGLATATDDELATIYAEIAGMVERIAARGGRVVFVAFPTSGLRRQLDEQFHPRARYWDAFAAAVPGATFVHFEDFPTLSGFDCPDLSHLDQADAPAFTAALADVLLELEVFE